MAEITCPKCHTTFNISEEEYKSIKAQLRDQEFAAALHEREQAFKQRTQDAVKLAEAALIEKAQRKIAEKDTRIAELAAEIKAAEGVKSSAVNEIIAQKAVEIERLKGQIESQKKAAELEQNNLKASFEQQLKLKDEQIGQLKDFKAKQSTKMVGESLEVFCKNEFALMGVM